MAIATLSPAFLGLSGRMGDCVFRKVGGRTIVASVPKRSCTAPTDRQIAQRQRFQKAARYARSILDNPPAREFYAALGTDRETTGYAAAVRDFLNPPIISDIALGLYQGRPEDEIIVRATDDTEVAGVTVTIRDRTGSVVETGQARPWDDVWIYDATVLAPAGQPLAIEVTAIDRPGNEVTRREPWVPGSNSGIW